METHFEKFLEVSEPSFKKVLTAPVSGLSPTSSPTNPNLSGKVYSNVTKSQKPSLANGYNTFERSENMQYFISFLEGILTFISPCLLPMLPIYVSYFAGGEETTTRRTLKHALGFVCGFTFVFVSLGALAGTLGALVSRHRAALNIVTGLVVVFFGDRKSVV